MFKFEVILTVHRRYYVSFWHKNSISYCFLAFQVITSTWVLVSKCLYICALKKRTFLRW